ncbi:hypothetical protein Tco_1003892 [Tanacetum coccineum]|uniref:Retrotransposon gag domain-containing protein n=1 Tax=Tanacetum coccineum TaxID=301880 RepID=A0ABQ5FB02_9ASTR
MMELRDNTFSGNRADDVYEHVQKVLEIVSLFSISGVNHDTIMLRVFPITLTGAANRWKDRLPTGSINTWALLEKAFIQTYCPPSRTANQLEEIHNFKQEDDETLYHTWERRIGLHSNDGFIDIKDESYKERMCKFLGMKYRKPPSITIKKFEIIRYTIRPEERYIKVKVVEIDEITRTISNVAMVRARLMEEMDEDGRVKKEQRRSRHESNVKTLKRKKSASRETT